MQLYNGNCMELLKTIPDNSIDLVVTDPPYEIATTGGGLAVNGQVKQWKEHDLDGMKDGFSPVVLDELCRVMKKINCYFFCSQKQIMPLVKYFVEGKKCNWNLLCWHKNNPVPACGNKYLSDTEYILFFREKGVKIYGEYETKKTYYVTASNQKEKKLYGHPTVKPVEILKNLIFNSSLVDETVLDPFMGTGSTGVACKELGRNFIGIELDATHFATAKARLGE
jgi:DNA modification methylase